MTDPKRVPGTAHPKLKQELGKGRAVAKHEEHLGMSAKVEGTMATGGSPGGGPGDTGGPPYSYPSVFYYQTLEEGGTPLTQRPVANFDTTDFELADDGPGNETDIALKATGVVAAVYAYPSSVDVDSKGRITDITAGGPPGSVGGSGTDNHVPRWNGSADIEDTDWIIDPTAVLYCFDNAALIEIGRSGDTGGRWVASSFGTLAWGDGGGTQDVSLSRLAAHVLSLGAGDALNIPGQAGDHSDTTQGDISYNTTTDKHRINENGTWVYPDNLTPLQTGVDANLTISATTKLVVFGTALTATRAANLPALGSVPTGHHVTVKDDGAINGPWKINVTPNGTDKIEGVNAVDGMVVPRGWRIYVKAGSGWLTTGSL